MKSLFRSKLKQVLKLQRTEKFPIKLEQRQIDKFHHAQCCYMAFGNYGRKYLYRNYGYDNLFKRPLPKTSMGKHLLRDKMRQYALSQMHKKFKVEKDKQLPYYFDRQSIDKLYDELLTNFLKYKRLQFKLSQSRFGQRAYEVKMKRKGTPKKWTGYGRIKYVHDPTHYRTIAFKGNNGQSVKFINNFSVKLPYFGKVRLLQGIKKYRKRKITEAKLQSNRGKLYLLLTYEKRVQRNLPNNVLQNKDRQLGIDWNQNSKSALTLSTSKLLAIPEELNHKLEQLDQSYRLACHFLDNHRNDDNVKTRYYSLREQNCKRKYSNLMKDWYTQQIKNLVNDYDVFAIEDLASFSMRQKNYQAKGKNTKKKRNINHSLARRMPGIFKKLCESLITNAGKLLIEVDSYDTSKACHNCSYINKQLKVGTEAWICPNCNKHHQRDLNAAQNILAWSLMPEKHIKWLLHLNKPDKNFKFLKRPSELVQIF